MRHKLLTLSALALLLTTPCRASSAFYPHTLRNFNVRYSCVDILREICIAACVERREIPIVTPSALRDSVTFTSSSRLHVPQETRATYTQHACAGTPRSDSSSMGSARGQHECMSLRTPSEEAAINRKRMLVLTRVPRRAHLELHPNNAG